jgi:hypothetical protein
VMAVHAQQAAAGTSPLADSSHLHGTHHQQQQHPPLTVFVDCLLLLPLLLPLPASAVLLLGLPLLPGGLPTTPSLRQPGRSAPASPAVCYRHSHKLQEPGWPSKPPKTPTAPASAARTAAGSTAQTTPGLPTHCARPGR